MNKAYFFYIGIHTQYIYILILKEAYQKNKYYLSEIF